ncbi:MAG: hypothetical protein P4L51_27095 [Puia sp.]|nr:hypothetical protein [Puia sp.]
MKLALFLALCFYACMQTLSVSAQTCGDTGPKDASTASNNTGAGSFVWTNPANAEVSDGNYATAGVTLSGLGSHATSNYLILQNFGFSFPTTDVICGIVVKITRNAGGIAVGGSVADNSVMLTSGGSQTGSNYASGSAWPGSNTQATYGGSTDLWGAGSWTPAQVNAADFGVAVSAIMHGGILSLALSANIDEISVTIYARSSTGLAITMQQFSANASGQSTLLSWTASSNDNLDQFSIQRSGDSKTWQDIASVNALPGANEYTYKDANPLPGPNYYRLLLENYGAAPDYSVVKEVFFQGSGKPVTLYPNPVTDAVNISGVTAIGRVILRDTQGRMLRSIVPTGGSMGLRIPVAELAKGIYLLQVDGRVYEILKQ